MVISNSGGAALTSSQLTAALQAGGAGANQSIEVDATQVDGGGVDNSYGVVCRAATTGDRYYVLWAGSDGTAGILKAVPDASGSITMVVLVSTNVSADTSYHLRADCNGSRLALFANGANVAEAQDGDYKSGRVGLYVATNDATGIDVAFTNLTISRP